MSTPGIDDSLALLYAVASPDAELSPRRASRATSTRVRSPSTRERSWSWPAATDIEVALGREIPLVRALETTPETHGPQGLGHAVLPPPTAPISDRHAVDVILDEARRRPGEITLVTLGPLTNLAIAVLREPALPGLLKGYALMGGAFGVSGNTTPTTEWNIHCDPEAAKIVFRAWAAARRGRSRRSRGRSPSVSTSPNRPGSCPRTSSGWPAARAARPDDSLALARGEDPMLATRSVASNPIVRYVADALRFYMEFHARYDGFYGAFIHDPLAVAAALDRSLVTTEALYVDVETRGEITSGMTVADRRRLTGKPPNLDVAVTANVAEFLDRLVERVGGLAATIRTCHARDHGTPPITRVAAIGREAQRGHQLGPLRHTHDRPDPDRDGHQHRARPDRRVRPQGPDLPGLDRDDPGRRPGRTDPRSGHRRPRRTSSGPTCIPAPFHSDFAAPFAVVAAWIGLLSGLAAQWGFFRSRPNASWGQVAGAALVVILVLGGIGYYGFLPFYTDGTFTFFGDTIGRRAVLRRCSAT